MLAAGLYVKPGLFKNADQGKITPQEDNSN
jgi:hypothetical protein